MKLSHLALVVALSAVTAFAVGKYTAAPAPSAAKQETAFERVMRTGTLRCGYAVMPPHIVRDPNTGNMSGLSYELMNEAAKRLNLTANWSEEVTFSNLAEGFKSKRYDALCVAGYRWVPMARALEYSVPLFYTTTHAYARADDLRFDNNLQAIDDPTVKIVITDGAEASSFIRSELFPHSGAYSVPGNQEQSFLLEAVATRKADIALFNVMEAMPYLVSNPDKLRRIPAENSLKAFAHAFSFGKGEHALTSMFDVALTEMLTDGTIDKILDKYEAIPDSFVRIKSPITYHEKTETK